MRLQQVGAACTEAYGSEVEVLPLDVCAPFSELHSAAVRADAAFEGAGIDYFIHNAGGDMALSLTSVADPMRLFASAACSCLALSPWEREFRSLIEFV